MPDVYGGRITMRELVREMGNQLHHPLCPHRWTEPVKLPTQQEPCVCGWWFAYDDTWTPDLSANRWYRLVRRWAHKHADQGR